MTPQDMGQVQAYLRSKLDNNQFRVIKRSNADDSAEIWLGDEFLGVVYRDEDEGELSFAVHISIIADDLPSR